MAAQDHTHGDARTLANLAPMKSTYGLAQQLLVFGHRKIRWWLRPTSSRCRWRAAAGQRTATAPE
jgi:hypothetical protein